MQTDGISTILQPAQAFANGRISCARKWSSDDCSTLRSTGLLSSIGLKLKNDEDPARSWTAEKPITRAEREARKAFRQLDATTAMTEHDIAQKAFSDNRERLKTERLAREASAPVDATKPKSKKKSK
jgi:hypothetical protein